MSLWYLSLVKTLIHEVRVTCPGWFNMEFLNEASFLHRNRMTILKLCLIHFHSRSCQRNMPPISPIYNRKWSKTGKEYWRKFVSKLYIESTGKSKDLLIRLKLHETSFYFYYYLPYICLVDVIYLTCFVFLKSAWWLVWIFCAPLNLKNKTTGIEQKKIFRCQSKILKNVSWPINIWLNYFTSPTEFLRTPPTYLMYGP